MPHFVEDVEAIRQRAANKIEEGAVTSSYKGSAEETVSILNEALATEIVCVLRYLHHYFMATGVHGQSVADEFKEHADAEREHADRIAERIQQLGGKPDFNPRSLMERSVSQYIEGETLADMIREDLIAERIVIEVYQQMIRHFAYNDPTTRHIIEEILEDEEEHASDLSDMLYVVDPRTGETEGRDPGTTPLEEGGGQRHDNERQQREGKQQERPRHGREAIAREADETLNQLAEMQRREQRGHAGRQQRRDQRQENRGNRQQGRGPSFRSPGQPGRSFAGEERPNPPGPVGSAALNERQQQEQFAGRGSASRGGEQGGQRERGRGRRHRGRRAA